MHPAAEPFTINMKVVYYVLIVLGNLGMLALFRRKGRVWTEADKSMPMSASVVIALILFILGGLLCWALISGWVRLYVPADFNPRNRRHF